MLIMNPKLLKHENFQTQIKAQDFPDFIFSVGLAYTKQAVQPGSQSAMN